MTEETAAGPGESTKAVAERVADLLRDRIVKGDLAPHDRLVERHLSAELAVSRTPIREALKLLEADGLIEISLHRGAQVAPYRATDALRLFDVISVLEGLAARRLAESISPAVLDRLEELHTRMLRHHARGRATEYFDVNTTIHDTIVAACANPVLVETHQRLIARARRGRFLAIMEPARLAQAVGEHEAVMEAFRARDGAAAAQVWEQHLRHTGETVAGVLAAQERDTVG
jgi:DNA-binding GntR family transcriptional regulator